MEKLSRRKGIIKGQLTRLSNYIEAHGAKLSYDDLRVRCDNAHKLYTEFIATEDAMFDLDSTVSSEMDIVDDSYYSIIPKLQNLMRATAESHHPITHESPMDSSTAVNPTSDFKLPSLTMPSFDGNLKDWQSFYDIFSSTVHENTSLSPAQKFKYLKGLLKGNAYNLISHLRVDDASYIEAIQRLVKRYDKKKPIVEAHIKSFLDQPRVSKANAAQLVAFHDNIDEVVRGLKALGKEAEARDPWLLFMATDRLDDETRKAWRYKTAEEDFPTVQGFLDFLLSRVDALTEIKPTSVKDIKSHQSSKVLHLDSISLPSCILCNVEHRLFECAKFKSMSINDRRQFLKEKRRCFNCLGGDHSVYQCRSRRTCHLCHRRHHTLVHSQSTQCSSEEVKPSTSTTLTASIGEHHNPAVVSHPVSVNAILPTVLVEVRDSYNNWHTIRGLLDSGSTRSLIKESCVNKLNLTKANARVSLQGIGGTKAGCSRGITNITIRSRINHDISYNIDALIVTKLTEKLPTNPMIVHIPSNIKTSLADPTFEKPGSVDLLIGSDYFFEILNAGQVVINNQNIIYQNTRLGWIVAGGRSPQDISTTSNHMHLTEQQEVDIDKALRQFWETESLPQPVEYTSEEAKCIDHYTTNVQCNTNGRITVALPFRRNPPQLGHSFNIALRQFQALEKRLSSNVNLQTEYVNFMREYERLGHMRRIPSHEIDQPGNQPYYLPHHGVIKSSDCSKLRVVFNGSQKTSSGQSLNDELMVGPTVQQGLFEITLRYRKHKFVFSADIEKMYRQVMVRDEDTDYQRILWRESPNHQLQHYRLLTVTYGTAPAPFLATYSLSYIANKFHAKYPNTADALNSDVYVDDVITGSSTLNGALILRNELIEILGSAGFKLRKWSANHPHLLDDINEADLQPVKRSFNDSAKMISILGLYYEPSSDVFRFKVTIPETSVMTKRILLSESSRIFDPLGWLSPTTIIIKVMFQQLWLEKLGWDDALPESCKTNWKRLRNELSTIEQLEVNRWLYSTETIEIHGFCDASKDAYAAVLYSRVVISPTEVYTNIIAAKARVAPIKTVSIPRLELCAATLLVKLMETVTTALNFETTPNQFFYTDAKIVLDWLSKPPKSWPTYVGNRTGLILSYSNRNQWHHVKSAENPADRATRGVPPSELKNDTLWWRGSSWLCTDPLIIPSEVIHVAHDEEPDSQSYHIVQEVDRFDQQLEEMITRVSKYPIIIRIVARIRRYILNAKRSTEPKSYGSFTVNELNQAESYILKHVQAQAFSRDIKSIHLGQLSPKSKLFKLYPFADNHGILRVSGRLANAPLNFDIKHPIILPSNHLLVQRMIEHYHRKLYHAGISQLASYTMQRFHIVRGKHLIKKTIHQCITCHRHKVKVQTQLMGQLPSSRVTFIRPFIKTGLDYAGPYRIKAHQIRNSKIIKGYICIFVCMAIKAVHIELVTNLSAESFIAALRRFQGTRGICTDLYSDNATNFIGAINQLQELQDLFNSPQFSPKISNWAAEQGTQWHLIPPAAPNFGGLWEAAVKSTKFHIKRVIGETIMSYEELLTFLKEIEAILNSRPLCRNDESEDPLTPAHFILGHPMTLIPEPSLLNTKLNTLSRWQMIQKLIQQFWVRWHAEYLTTLNQFNKCNQAVNNVNVGDLVILKEENVPPARWPLARILEVHPGQDNLIRVVTVQTATSTFKRPISKICIIPLIDSSESMAAECSTSIPKCVYKTKHSNHEL